MKIKKGIYELNTDAQGNVWIMEEYECTVRNKDTKEYEPLIDEETGLVKLGQKRVSGYASSFKEVRTSFLKLKMKGNDATDIQEVLDILVKAEKNIDEFKGVLDD